MKRRGNYNYTNGEKELNRAFKMQEKEIDSLQRKSELLSSGIDENLKEIDSTASDIEALSERINKLRKKVASVVNRDIPMQSTEKKEYTDYLEDSPLLSKEKIESNEIPSWKEVMKKTDSIVPEDVILEDLLSAQEFQFCKEEVERINQEFSQKTSLNKLDVKFLMVATALQTARWLIIQEIMGELGDTYNRDERLAHDDKSIKDEISRQNKDFQDRFKNHGHQESANNYKSWEQIIFSSAPYDTTVGSPIFGENMEGGAHRYKTLGHDPILGWIFGTANFITDTITLSNWHSYNISRKADEVYMGNRPHFHSRTTLPNIFYDTCCSIKEDYLRLPAAVFAQFVHLKSDAFTKYGLPIPILETFSENLAGKLYKSQYDALCLLKDLKTVGTQTGFSILINMLISLIHGLFYKPDKDGKKDFYEVRTRKILLFSNTISSTINLAYVGVNAYIGNEAAWKKLDAGGLLVTLWRLFSDIRFITRIKQQFIQEEMDKVTKESLEQLNSYFK